jgi:hypothetical protein
VVGVRVERRESARLQMAMPRAHTRPDTPSEHTHHGARSKLTMLSKLDVMDPTAPKTPKCGRISADRVRGRPGGASPGAPRRVGVPPDEARRQLRRRIATVVATQLQREPAASASLFPQGTEEVADGVDAYHQR